MKFMGETEAILKNLTKTIVVIWDCKYHESWLSEKSKRCSEALCQAYIKQKGLDVVIPRLTRSYGPTL